MSAKCYKNGMSDNTIIIGSNPMRENFLALYGELGRTPEVVETFGSVDSVASYDEVVILTTPQSADPMAEDNRALEYLRMLADDNALRNGADGSVRRNGKRTTVWLLLQSQVSLWLLQQTDFTDEVNAAFDVYPMTKEDVWAKNCVLQHHLDRGGISMDSDKTVHVVVCGFDAYAEALAVHVALVAHYPNYDGKAKKPRRSRVTIVDSNVRGRRDEFVARYQHLFANSFYRTIDVDAGTSELHRPMYEGRRQDFVDVEWEFVNASVSNPVVRGRLERWAADECQQLTVVVSHGNAEQDITEAMSMPQSLYDRNVPVLSPHDARCGIHHQLSQTFRLWEMAKLLNYFYECSYGDVGVPTELPKADVETAWERVGSYKMRMSNLANVMTISSKMRSLGHDTDDVEAFYALTKDEIESLAETEHNRWSVERLLTGSRPCNDAEREEIRQNIEQRMSGSAEGWTDLKKAYKKRNIHYDLCAYDELGYDPTGKSAKVYDYDLTACIPLIARTIAIER